MNAMNATTRDARTSCGIPDGVPSSPHDLAYLLAEVVSGIVLYDALFFVVHCLLHATASVHHKRHHVPSDLRARDVLEHSAMDGTLQVLVNIACQRSTPWGAAKSRLGRALHNVIVTWMLTESHSAAPTKRVWRHCFKGVQRHRSHHLAGAPACVFMSPRSRASSCAAWCAMCAFVCVRQL